LPKKIIDGMMDDAGIDCSYFCEQIVMMVVRGLEDIFCDVWEEQASLSIFQRIVRLMMGWRMMMSDDGVKKR
jgi:hypothetical protein